MTLTSEHLRWLTLIRYQARMAEEQSAMPAPLSTLSIGGFQDCVEAMLVLVAEHRNIPLRRLTEFDKLFDDVAACFSDLTYHRSPLTALNRARVGFKHNGNEAAPSTIERSRVSAMNFLAEASQLCLDQDFDAISLAKLITYSDVRLAVESAEQRWRAGDRHQAMLGLRQAFMTLMNTYEQANRSEARGLFSSRPRGSSAHQAARMRTLAEFGAFGSEHDDHRDRWLQNLDDRVKLLALGVDTRRYAYLDTHAPLREFRPDLDEGPFEVTDEVFNRCHRFVVDTALRLAADDFR